MTAGDRDPGLRRRQIDRLYGEAMLLADEARTYFDVAGHAERQALDPMLRVTFSCESLKVTTRLMYVIAWLLTQRAVEAGELAADAPYDADRRLGRAPETEPAVLALLPPAGRAIVDASTDLYRRAALFDDVAPVMASPVRSLLARLTDAF